MSDHFSSLNSIKIIDVLYRKPNILSDEALAQEQQCGLMFESIELQDIYDDLLFDGDSSPEMMLEAITAVKSRLKQKMKAFNRKFASALNGTGITALEPEIGKTRKVSGLAILAVKIPTSDGQSISIIFHSPDNKPEQITERDTLVAFRFLLNSRDVTHVVAPSGGREVSLAQVTMALSNLLERNSAKFVARQAESKQNKEELKALQDSTSQIETKKTEIAQQVEDALSNIEDKKSLAAKLKAQRVKLEDGNKQLKKQIANKTKAKEKRQALDSAIAQFTLPAYNKGNIKFAILELANQVDNAEIEALQKASSNILDKVDNQKYALLHEQLSDAVTMTDKQAFKAQLVKCLESLSDIDSVKPPAMLNEGDTINVNGEVGLVVDELKQDGATVTINDKQKQLSNDQLKRAGYINPIAPNKKSVESSIINLSNAPELSSKFGMGGSGSSILKAIRKDIKLAKDNQDIPKKVNATVRNTGSSNLVIDANIRSLPDDFQLFSDSFLMRYFNAEEPKVERSQFTKEANNLITYLDSAVNAYHDGKDYTDNQHTVFYFSGFKFTDELIKTRLHDEADHFAMRVYADKIKSEEEQYLNVITGSKFDAGASFGDVVKAIRAEITKDIKSSNGPLAGARISVNKTKSTHQNKVSIKVNQLSGENDFNTMKTELERIAQQYNKTDNANSVDDSTSSAFFIDVIDNTPSISKDFTDEELQTPSVYAQIMKSQELQEWYQDPLDSFFQRRIIAVRNELRARDWQGEQYKALSKAGFTLDTKFKQVGAGANVVGIDYSIKDADNNTVNGSEISDNMSKTPIEIAAELDNFVKPSTVEDLHWYGLRARPLMIGAQPKKAASLVLDTAQAKAKFGDSNDVRHGAVAYDAPLTEEEISSFELVDLTKVNDKSISPEDVAEWIYEVQSEDVIRSLVTEQEEQLKEQFVKLTELKQHPAVVNRETDKASYNAIHKYTVDKVLQEEVIDELKVMLLENGQKEEPVEPASTPNEKPTNNALPKLSALKEAIISEADPDKLIELIEEAMAEVEADDSMDEHSITLEEASNRVTELLEAS